MSNGVHLKRPNEHTRLVVPVNLNFIGDNPEVCVKTPEGRAFITLLP